MRSIPRVFMLDPVDSQSTPPILLIKINPTEEGLLTARAAIALTEKAVARLNQELSVVTSGVVTATLLVTFGRISDMFGRVRLYNLGFAIFAVGSILLYLVHGTGNGAAMQIIIFRLVQAVGGAFLMANSTAILTDAFPPNQRGLAMGINMIAGTT